LTVGDMKLRKKTVVSDEEVDSLLRRLAAKPFDLNNSFSLKVYLITSNQSKGEKQWLLVHFHHIAIDGWAVPIAMDELSELYPFQLVVYYYPFYYIILSCT
jgi:Condensation domain